jgi:hypothetical protein
MSSCQTEHSTRPENNHSLHTVVLKNGNAVFANSQNAAQLERRGSPRKKNFFEGKTENLFKNKVIKKEMTVRVTK